MEQGDVKSYFGDLSAADGTQYEGSFPVTTTSGRNLRLKGFWYVCVGAKRGNIKFYSGSDVILEFVIVGNLAAGCGIVTIPGNGIPAPSGITCTVTDDDDSGGGARSVTVFYQG